MVRYGRKCGLNHDQGQTCPGLGRAQFPEQPKQLSLPAHTLQPDRSPIIESMIGPLSERPGRNPLLILFGTFVAWKTLIFLIALSSPGVGYDTSTDLLLHEADADAFSSINTGPHRVRSSVFKLVRWDAIYYTHLAERGHVFEQEWAFGIGLSSAISVLARSKWPLSSVHGGRLTIGQ